MADDKPSDDDLASFDITSLGEHDHTLVDCIVHLTPAQILERHYRARMLVKRMLELAKERYGPLLNDSRECGR
jgi:hypothetical protein